MSTVSRSRAPEPGSAQLDPFRYGWRYVRVQGSDGTESLKQVPLTLKDVLFPRTGDFIAQTDLHDSDLNYLKDVFKARLVGDPQAAVVSDCRVDWNLEGVEPLGPDFGGEALAAVLADSRAPLKAALLDQRRIAGLGNIYVSEAMYAARLSPMRAAGSRRR